MYPAGLAVHFRFEALQLPDLSVSPDIRVSSGDIAVGVVSLESFGISRPDVLSQVLIQDPNQTLASDVLLYTTSCTSPLTHNVTGLETRIANRLSVNSLLVGLVCDTENQTRGHQAGRVSPT